MHIITEQQINAFKKFIDSYDNFIVVGHKEPDGDCISSCLAIATLLNKKGKSYQLVSAGPFKRPEIKVYENMFAKEAIILQTEKKQGIIILDCGEFSRVGDIFPSGEHPETLNIPTFVIDHHKTSLFDPNYSIIDSTAPATVCIVQQLYEKLEGIPSKETSEYLFFGLATDTGYFRFLDEKSKNVFMAAARLVEYGVNPRQIYDKMTSGKPFSSRKLLGIMLDKAEQYFDGKLVITYETMEDTKKYGFDGRDSDSLYQLLLASVDVEAVVFIRQETEQSCTMGFRSKDQIDVSQIAVKFGGGGHKNAAGCSTPGIINNLIPKVIKEFENLF